MVIVPIFQDEAFSFVKQFHRHLSPPRGSVFQIAASDGIKILGVAIVGRPVSRFLCDGFTLEVLRLCTDGTPNVCSFLYSAAWRTAKSLGYRKLITYTLSSESGSSLRGAGWHLVGQRGGGSWNCPSRPRVDKHPTQLKMLFEKKL